MRGILKRKFAEVDEDSCSSSSSPLSSLSSPASSEWEESDGESSLSDNQQFTSCSSTSPSSLPIKSILKGSKSVRSNVRFDRVTVFSFPRCQGFTSVPSRGGATLGMVWRHSALHRYTLAEHALEQQHRRRERLWERLREDRLEALRHKLIASGAIDQREADRLTVDQVPDVNINIHISDAELEVRGFLQPYSAKQRQALLRRAGVKRIDKEEKRQLHALRLSREKCGCDCKGFCEPETCACSLAGIKCQMDRFNFPCGCTKDGCGNAQGRIEFNPRRVQTHRLHTVMRLELERQMQDETLNQLDQRAVPEELQEDEDRVLPVPEAQERSCPFGFTAEEDCLPLTMPSISSFHFIPERPVVEENSCSSDATDSCCFSTNSEDSDAWGSPLRNRNVLEVDDGGLARDLSIHYCEGDDCSTGSDGRVRHIRLPLAKHTDCGSYSTTTDTTGPLCMSKAANTFPENIGRATGADYLDENANQSTDFFDDSSIEECPNTPSPSIDYSSSSYMDLSLSESDLEFFDSDCSSGPLHNSFKGQSQVDCFRHLQLLSSWSLPQYSESNTCLLESLIGLSEPSQNQDYPLTDNLRSDLTE
ncbi:cysteine/serine-rich nuclear protein 1-like [Lampris incognitus]|uniref:cysteine/serine-rich nuclear protein 1-like n=1 Tax=Lampris incognitus TaxID=2546036 RepID=UPI0024B56A32|nr:cysteine/serine-rich nuclear protein 1-like [Lampris incognitus]